MYAKSARRFWFENQIGELVPLNGENGIWFTDPEGLGIETDVRFTGKGGFFLKTMDNGEKQATPKGVLQFRRGNPYMQYRLLMDWLFSAEQLYLVYEPARQADRFRRRIELARVDKRELERTGYLRCPTLMRVTTPWMLPRNMEAAVTATGTEPFVVGVSLVGADRLSDGYEYVSAVTVAASGHIPASFLLTHSAGSRLVNPVITVTGKTTHTEYGRVSLGTVSPAETLEYSTEPFRSYIRARSANAVRDLLPDTDVHNEPYPRLPTDETVEICMTTDEPRRGTMRVVVQQYRRAV